MLAKIVDIWRREGPLAVLRRAARKVRRPLARPRPRGVPAGRLVLEPTATYAVIVLSIIDWDFRFQRPQQLARQLASRGHRVYYLRTHFVRGPSAATVSLVEPNVAEVVLSAPRPANAYRERLSEDVADAWATAFARVRDEERIAEAVMVVQLPYWRPLAVRLRERLGWGIAYDCIDRHAEFITNAPEMVAEERALTREADVVIASSRLLASERESDGAHPVLIPNAGDFDRFSAPAPEPRELRGLARPIVGYYGAVSDWFDAPLLAAVARARPRLSFVIVGGTDGADLRALRRLANVTLIGEQPYPRIASFAQSFDAIVIPFKRTPLTEAADPVKVYECLAAGKPVVSVRLGEVAELEREGLVYVADDAAQMTAAIDRALAEEGPARVTARREYARRNTWSVRGAALDDALSKTLSARGAARA